MAFRQLTRPGLRRGQGQFSVAGTDSGSDRPVTAAGTVTGGLITLLKKIAWCAVNPAPGCGKAANAGPRSGGLQCHSTLTVTRWSPGRPGPDLNHYARHCESRAVSVTCESRAVTVTV